jgi:Ser/Thr protein kinase RdoA (MazF antagonist)
MHRSIRHKIPREFRKQYDIVRKVLLSVRLPKGFPRGPIHVDIKPENVLVRQGKLVGVLDFDNSYVGPYLVDIGKAVTWWCIKRGKINMKHFAALILGYEQKRKLTDPERKFLGPSILYSVASHIFLDYYKYAQGIVPLSYLRMLHREFYPILIP